MKIQIEINEPKKDMTFADIHLSYKLLSNEFKAKANINFNNFFDFMLDNRSPGFDLFFVSVLIFSVDRLVSRKYADDGWTRYFEISIPVYNLDIFKAVEEDFNKTISFLTGDIWSISFIKNNKKLIFKEVKKDDVERKSYSFSSVSLFSGGMDSLIGILDFLYKNPEKNLVLVSHYGYPRKVHTDQEEIFNCLTDIFKNRVKWLKCRVDLSKERDNLEFDENSRSRSILFLSLGLYIAANNKSGTNLLISENGSISLNFPLTKSRYSSCSTRTTHPTFINMLTELLSKMGINIPIINHYALNTKGEMVSLFKDKNEDLEIINLSNSCAKRGHKRVWKNRGAEHCGYCLPCIYRRAALHKISLDYSNDYGIDVFNVGHLDLYDTKSTITKDFKTLLHFLKANYSKEDISTELINNGLNDLEKLNDFVKVVLKTRNELKALIADKGNDEIRKLAGL